MQGTTGAAGHSKKRERAKERVKVHCRLRPTTEECERVNRANRNDEIMLSTFLTKDEQSHTSTPVVKDYDSQGNFVFDRNLGNGETSNCKYDTFLPPSATQEETYNKCAKGIIQDVMDGYNGTVLVYGQTGSGKTHTMVGPPRVIEETYPDPALQNGDDDMQDNERASAVVQVEGMRGDDRGLIPRALHDIFQTIKDRSDDVLYTVRMSYVQIYCELILDLLDEDDPAAFEGRYVNVRENADGEVYLDGAVTMEVNSAEECLHLLDTGNQNRVTACTRMNATSSRSHAVLQLQIEGRNVTDSEHRAGGGQEKVFRGKLFLVDLAGSERVSKSGVLHQQFTEMKAINLSLCALGNCVAALAQHNGHIPYRDSKLTRLLQNSLGGNSKTSMVITISPAEDDRAESWSAVQFGHRAMKIAVSANKAYEIDYRAVCRTLQNRLDKAEEKNNLAQVQLNQAMSEMEAMRSKYAKLSSQKEALESELKALKATMDTLSEGQTGGTMITQPPVSIEELQQRVNEQLDSLRKEHEDQLAELRTKYENQLETHKGASNQATEEWHTIEYDLEKEKEGHLDSLRFLREAKEQMVKMEMENSARLSELMDDLERKNQIVEEMTTKLEASRDLAAEKELEAENLNLKLKAAFGQHMRSKEMLSNDYVSRDEVEKMEALYNDAIERLTKRLDQLENPQEDTKYDRQQRGQRGPYGARAGMGMQTGGTPSMRHNMAAGAGSRVARDRGVPRPGRVEPASRVRGTGGFGGGSRFK